MGSSSINSDGRFTSACANSSRRTIPPEYVAAMSSATSIRFIASIAFGDAVGALAPWHVVEPGEPLDVLAARQRRLDRKLLRHIADVVANIHRLPTAAQPEDEHLTGLHGRECRQHPHDRGLARTVRAEKAHRLPRRHLQREVVHRGEVAIPVCQMPAVHGEGQQTRLFLPLPQAACYLRHHGQATLKGLDLVVVQLAKHLLERRPPCRAGCVGDVLGGVGQPQPSDPTVLAVDGAGEQTLAGQLRYQRRCGVRHQAELRRGLADGDVGLSSDQPQQLSLRFCQPRRVEPTPGGPPQPTPEPPDDRETSVTSRGRWLFACLQDYLGNRAISATRGRERIPATARVAGVGHRSEHVEKLRSQHLDAVPAAPSVHRLGNRRHG